jgi:REP element-mobilizing transposase RayT
MARKPRIHFPGAFYHCINRGNQRKPLYLSDDDFLFMLDTLAGTATKYGALIHGYCLMPNHFHALIQVQQVPLETVMRSCLTAYAKYFNRTHKKTGHVFERRYRAILCQKESYLLELVRYIHLNPLRAHLVENPQQWRWSSLNAYLHPAQHSWLYTKDVLERFGHHTHQQLASFLAQASILEPSQIYPHELFPILGDADFVKTASDPVSLRRHLVRQWPGPRLSLQEIANHLSQKMGLASQLLSLRRKGPQSLSHLRASLVYAATQYFFYHNAQIAHFLHISSSAVSFLYQKELAVFSANPTLEDSLFQELKQ